MRICIIGTESGPVPPVGMAWGGIETIAWMQAKGLRELGHEVALVTFHNSQWDGELIPVYPEKWTKDANMCLFKDYRAKILDFDVVIDNSNGKLARIIHPRVINVSHWLQNPQSMGFSNIVCISEAHARWTASWMPKGKPEVVMNGLDPDLFPFQPKKEDWFLFLSVMGKYKGADTCLQLALKGKPIHFAGRNADMTDEIKRASQKHSNIVFHGEVSHETKKQLMGNARGLLQLAKPYNPQDQFPFMDIAPLTIMEANFCGTPAIGLKYGGIPEMIEEGVNGFLSEDDQVMAKMEKIDEISPQKCREYAEKRFSHIRMCRQYEHLSERLLRGQPW